MIKADITDLIDFTEGGTDLPQVSVQRPVIPMAVNAPAPTTFGLNANVPPPVAAPLPVQPPPYVPPTQVMATPVSQGPMLPPLQPGQPMVVEENGRPVNSVPMQPMAAPPQQPAQPLPTSAPVVSVAKNAAEAALEAQIFGTAAPAPVAVNSPAAATPAPISQVPTQPPPYQPPQQQFQQPSSDGGEMEFDGENGEEGLLITGDDDCDFVQPTMQVQASIGGMPAQPMTTTVAAVSPPIVEQPAKPIAQGVNTYFPDPNIKPVQAPGQHKDDDELAATEAMIAEIEGYVTAVWFKLGIGLLRNPAKVDSTSLAHKAIYYARWEPGKIIELPPHEILTLGSALSAHMIEVASQETEWKMRFEVLGKELDRVINIKRENYQGKTKGDQEAAVIKNEPAMRELRRRYMVANAMARLLDGMGDRFQQYENSFKRPADFKVGEYRKETGGQWQHRG